MRHLTLLFSCVVVILVGAALRAQPGHPLVTMTVESGGEKPRELTARDSGLATLKLKSGAEFGFRPIVQDSKPWSKVTVTIFKMDPSVEVLGEVSLETGKPAVASKTKPAFRIAVTKIAEPPVGPTTPPAAR
jgi:hypothetical protein